MVAFVKKVASVQKFNLEKLHVIISTCRQSRFKYLLNNYIVQPLCNVQSGKDSTLVA